MYQAWINTPGFLPVSDEEYLFDTIAGAWEYLAQERERDEDMRVQDCCDPDAYAEQVAYLHNQDTVGTVVLHTPGYTGDRDLGLAYSVAVASPEVVAEWLANA